MKRIIIIMLCGFFSIHIAMAEEKQSSPLSNVGEASPTQQWLELQRSGRYASPQSQPISGEVMDKVHQRYLKSFEKPIPESYEHESTFTR